MEREILPELNSELKILLDKIILNEKNRNETFYEIGQKYLLKLSKRELFLETVNIFEYFLQNREKWVGENFIVPELYQSNRHTTKEIVFRDMTYYVRESFMWSVLYQKYEYIQYDEKGTAYLNKKPEVRITEMNMEKKYSKNEHGGLITTNVKPDPSKKLTTGFTVAQANEIINAALVGYLPEDKPYEINTKTKSKKPTQKEVEEYTEEDFLKEAVDVSDKKEKKPKVAKAPKKAKNKM